MSEDNEKRESEAIDMNTTDMDEMQQYEDIQISHSFENEDDFFSDISESLKQQVNEELMKEQGETVLEETQEEPEVVVNKRHTAIKVMGSVILCLLAMVVFLVGTRPGRKLLIDIGADIIAERMDNDASDTNKDNELFTKPTISVEEDIKQPSPYRKEEYVANFLICGIEEIGGGGRTDSMMIASVNIKDRTIKLTSLMRDCYVEIEGHDWNKLNSAYAFGGMDLLVDTVQRNFKIYIDGYASVNFNSFERIVDMLGGVDIELGKSEANYLNTTNYISNPVYRDVTAGWNTLNGNQALGYARVRKVVTLGGANNDFGRTLRQRRLLNAIFEKYKSKNIMELFQIMYDILPEIKTNLTSSQISDVIEEIVENGIMTIDNYRIPAEGYYSDGNNSHGYVLLLDFQANIKQIYQNIFLDEPDPTPTPIVE